MTHTNFERDKIMKWAQQIKNTMAGLGLMVIGVMVTGCGLPPNMTGDSSKSELNNIQRAQTVKLLYTETSSDGYVKLEFIAPESTEVGQVVEIDWTLSLVALSRKQKLEGNEILGSCTTKGELSEQKVLVTNITIRPGQYANFGRYAGGKLTGASSYFANYPVTQQSPLTQPDWNTSFTPLQWTCEEAGSDDSLVIKVDYKYLEQAFICLKDGTSQAFGEPTWKTGTVQITWKQTCVNSEPATKKSNVTTPSPFTTRDLMER